MARNFNGGTDHLHWTDPGNTDSLGCVALWIKTTSSTLNLIPLSYWNSTSRNGWGLVMNNPTAGKLSAVGYETNTQRVSLASTTATLNNGAWHHVAYNHNRGSGGANALFIDGTQEATVNASGSWSLTSSNFVLQAGDQSDAFWPTLTGDLSELAYWKGVNLTADEIAALANPAKGFSPKLIRPGNLEFHAPLVRDTRDTRGLVLSSSSGGSATDHPRIIGGLV